MTSASSALRPNKRLWQAVYTIDNRCTTLQPHGLKNRTSQSLVRRRKYELPNMCDWVITYIMYYCVYAMDDIAV